MEKLKDVRFIVCDIDGTIVNEERVLTPRTKRVLQQLHQQGVMIGIASGRPLDEVQRTTEYWDLGFPVDCFIGMNGSELYDVKHEKRDDFFKLDKQWIKEIVDLMAPFCETPFIYLDGAIMCIEKDWMIEKSSAHAHKAVIVAKDISEMYAQDNAKILFRMIDEEKVAFIEKYFEEQDLPNYKAFKTQPTLIEFAHKDVSKAYALNKFCDAHNIPLSSVVGFGDTSNDNDMLIACGVGVCLLNGSDDTKALADYITEYTNEDDGLADFVEKYILN